MASSSHRTHPVTWIVLGTLVIIGVFVMMALRDRGAAMSGGSACKPVNREELVLWLDEDKREAEADFISKAERLNSAGTCVIEGAFGKAHQKFYFAVQGKGDPSPYFLRFTRDELRRR